jgi:hypothetical protein
VNSASQELQGVVDRLGGTLIWLAEAESRRDSQWQNQRNAVLTGPVKQPGNPFKGLDIQLPLLWSPGEIDLQAAQKRLAKHGLFVLDFSCNDTVKTLARLTDACKKSDIKLILDEEVKQRLAKQLPATFIVYLENANEEKLAGALAAMQQTDHWKNERFVTDTSCQGLMLYPLDPEGRRVLARGMAINPDKLQPRSGSSTKAEPGPGVVMAYYPTRALDSVSGDIRQALQSLEGARENAVSIVFFLRQGKP